MLVHHDVADFVGEDIACARLALLGVRPDLAVDVERQRIVRHIGWRLAFGLIVEFDPQTPFQVRLEVAFDQPNNVDREQRLHSASSEEVLDGALDLAGRAIGHLPVAEGMGSHDPFLHIGRIPE